MIHITEEGGRNKIGLNLYRTRGGFVVAWVWYYTATHKLKKWRFRLRMHMKPRILWSVDSCNVITNYLTIHDLQLVNRKVLVDLVASGNEYVEYKEPILTDAEISESYYEVFKTAMIDIKAFEFAYSLLRKAQKKWQLKTI